MTDLQRLLFLDSSVWMTTRNGLTALASKHFIDLQFYGLPEEEREKIYWNNPANTYLYTANKAIVDGTVVDLYENISNEEARGNLELEIPDRKDLYRHRVVLSHSGRVVFRRKDVERFFNDRGHEKEFETALRFWRTREALLGEINKLGGDVKFQTEVALQLGTVELIHGALALTLKDPLVLPPTKQFGSAVKKFFKDYESAIKISGHE